MGLVGGEAGLREVLLPSAHPSEVWARIQSRFGACPLDQAFGDLPERFRRYSRGQPVSFRDALDFTGTTPFQQAVWQETRNIPWGEKRSYRWLAQAMGRPGAFRAVGQALGQNPFPILVPCHRVVSSNGSLGGYSGGLGLKARLLAVEGA